MKLLPQIRNTSRLKVDVNENSFGSPNTKSVLNSKDLPITSRFKPIKVDEFVALSSRNTSLNTSRSYYSVFSNCHLHLTNSQITPNDKFLKLLDRKFSKIKDYVSKLKSPKSKPSKAQLFETLNNIQRARKGKRKLITDNNSENYSSSRLDGREKASAKQFKSVTPSFKNSSIRFKFESK